MGGVVSQIVGGTPVIKGATGMVTVMLVMAGFAHWPAFGVNVSVMFPLNPVGLKLLTLTPEPDQFPDTPLCVVGKFIAGADSQMEAGTPVIVGVVGKLTVILVVAGLAHWPTFGLKVKMTLPFKPEGLKLLLLTPEPVQAPITLLCVVGKFIAGADSQMEAGTPAIVGVVGKLTMMLVVAGLAH